MIDGFVIRAGHDIRDRAPDFEIAAELGGTRLNIKSLDSDQQRNLDQFAATAELGAAVGIETSTEFGPSLSTENLSEAVDVVRYVNRPDFRILMDSMHFFRSGGTIEDITALDPEIFAYIQLSDVPRVATIANYFEEATRERMVPGEGELPLLDFLAALPRDLVVGLEVPIRSLAEAGVGPHERMRRCVEAARNLLSELDTLDSQAEAAHAQAASD
jgi:sugar phosphate isomerase/epimerase